MSAPTFKVGDRVRSGVSVGIVTDQFSDGWVEISGRDTRSTWFMWVDAATCTPCPPMSPEAKVVWHAMRAGAKRADRYEWTDSERTTWRICTYATPGDGRLYLRVVIPRPERTTKAGR